MTGKEEKRNIKTYAALVFVLVFLFALTLMYLVNQEQEQEEKLKATYMAEATVSRVEAQLSQYLTKADVLKNLVEDGHELNDEQFKVLAQVMQDDTHIIEAIELAQDGIITQVYPLAGNEKAVANVINELSTKGAKVICQDTHVSGHACQEDLKLIYSLVHPKFAIPVHGEFRHRVAQKELAEYMGVAKDNAILVNSGDVVALDEDSCQVIDHVTAGGILVDGLGVGDVGNIVLRDRQNLAQNGIIVVVLTLEKHSNQLLSGPDIVSRGFVYVRESEDLLEEAHNIVANAVEDCLDRRVSDWGKIKNIIKDSLSEFLWKRMKRNPMILPIIMEV